LRESSNWYKMNSVDIDVNANLESVDNLGVEDWPLLAVMSMYTGAKQ